MRRIPSALTAPVVFFCSLPVRRACGSTLSWTFKLDPSQLRYRGIGCRSSCEMHVDGYSALEYFDYPSLPYRVVSVLMPQGEDVSSYRLEVLDEIIGRSGASRSACSREAAATTATVAGVAIEKARGRDRDGIFPEWRVRHLGSSLYRGYRIAAFAIYPVRYDHQVAARSRSRRMFVSSSRRPPPRARARRRERLRATSRASGRNRGASVDGWSSIPKWPPPTRSTRSRSTRARGRFPRATSRAWREATLRTSS